MVDNSTQVGHTVIVYERNNRFGGLLMYGIPTMKLSKEVTHLKYHEKCFQYMFSHNNIHKSSLNK